MRWTVTENEIGKCHGLLFSDLPDQLPANIRILHRNGILSILSENTAGILPCKNGNEIIIEPKYASIQPINLLQYINNISGITTTKERIHVGKAEINLHTIADEFVDQLRLITSTARKFQRIASNAVVNSVTGRVNWTKTVQAQHCGHINDIVTKIKRTSFEIPENMIISAAAKKVLALYSPSTDEHSTLIPWVELGMKTNYSYSDLYSLHKKLNDRALSGAHAYYYAPVMLAKIILGFSGAEILPEQIDSILFNMPGLYEEYVRTGFSRVSSKYGYSIHKGFVPRSFLFFDGESEMIPDITVYDGASVKAIIDVKYKAPDSADYYQLFAYQKYARVETVYIISPDVAHERTITTFEGSKVILIQVKDSIPSNLEYSVNKILQNIV